MRCRPCVAYLAMGLLVAACASKSLPPDSLALRGVAPYIQVRAHIDAQTALIALHQVTTKAGAAPRHDVEVMSYIASRPLPTGDVDLAKRFVRLRCEGVTETQIAQSGIEVGDGGYFRFTNLPCTLRINPTFRPTYTVRGPEDRR